MAGTQLSALRTELLARLGMGSVASPPAGTISNLNSILARCQGWLYWNYGWEALRNLWTVTPTIVNQSAYSFPASPTPTLEARKIINVTLWQAGVYVCDLREGIAPSMTGTSGQPTNYSRAAGKLNLGPAPNATSFSINIDAYAGLGPLLADTDTSTLDDDPILELAIALGKMHYGQMDGAASVQLVNALISRLNNSDETTGRLDLFNAPQQVQALTGVPMQAATQGMF